MGIERSVLPKGHPKRPSTPEIEHDTAMLRFLLERFNVDSLENSVELATSQEFRGTFQYLAELKRLNNE